MDVIKRLEKIVGEDNVLTKYEDKYCYTYDASAVSGGKSQVPLAVVFPANAQEVSEILKLANEERIPVIPRGKGTNVSGGSISVAGSIIMVLTKMDKIISIDKKNMVAVLEPGVITGEFQNQVEQMGLFYPPDPASKNFSTIGGNVAECAGGPRGAKYGVTRDYVLGLEVVLPTGEIVKTGAQTMKSVAGYDLTRLFVGSEGTLCVITKIIVKLIPLPEGKKTMLAIFDDMYKASETVAEVFMAGVVPTTMELLDNIYIKSIEECMKIGLPVDAEAVLLIEVDGDREVLDKHMNIISEICKKQGAAQVKIAGDDREAEELWVARRAAFAAVSRVRPTIIGEDATVPRDKIPAAVQKIREIADKYNIIIAVLGHAGDGNLHATILTDERDAEEMERVEQAADEMFPALLEMGGTLTGEHGIGRVKSKYLPMEVGAEGIALMKAIKRTLDPNNILNPSQMLGE
ncbi:FAD-binding oxidoreductase [Desulfitibacter alkalitolerans]|uniref:FAD-binding oxidoreductase n=1 Tax=Desulfitibacter alkalitolerans TaxID=264641 RepID=UPI0004875AD4|nr:FAD-linked oxidase C-terminal domain-containing protein [Desulfitibacter alkalitolerans]